MRLGHLAYLGVLAFCLIGTGLLELFLHVGVYRRWRRLALSILPVVFVFAVWDLYAIAHGHWTFDDAFTTGVIFPGDLPLDELLFFIVIPICAVLSFEAVGKVLAHRESVGQ